MGIRKKNGIQTNAQKRYNKKNKKRISVLQKLRTEMWYKTPANEQLKLMNKRAKEILRGLE